MGKKNINQILQESKERLTLFVKNKLNMKVIILLVSLFLVLVFTMFLIFNNQNSDVSNNKKPVIESLIFKDRPIRLEQGVYEYDINDYSLDGYVDENSFELETVASVSFNKIGDINHYDKIEIVLTSDDDVEQTYIININYNPSLMYNYCPLGDGVNYLDQVVFDYNDIVYTMDTCEINIKVEGDKQIKLIGRLIDNSDEKEILFNGNQLSKSIVSSISNIHIIKDAVFFFINSSDGGSEDKLYGLTSNAIIFERSSNIANDGLYFAWGAFPKPGLEMVDGNNIQFNLSSFVMSSKSVDGPTKMLVSSKQVELCSAPSNATVYASYKVEYLGNGQFGTPLVSDYLTVNDIKTDDSIDESIKSLFQSCK
jgi:hypothetical protein